ncbi:ATP-binding protein [Bacillus smithii]|uniref:ATP-binding protein n=1 Tax=Bacillus smithii TaxID=1479 RepID=UPI003D23360B
MTKLEYKTGKTSNAVKFPKPLLLATEKGYNALSGVMAQPINKWADFKKVLKQLKDPRAHELYETIILDTADILFDLCEKYICQREGVDKIGDIPYGAGYGMLEKEYDEALREIPLMDYGLVMISHSEDKEFKDENGESYNKIVPTLPKRPRKIVLRMADIIGYSKIVETEEGNKTYLYMRGTPRFEAGLNN